MVRPPPDHTIIRYCENATCGKPLPPGSRAKTCDATCRKAKSRQQSRKKKSMTTTEKPLADLKPSAIDAELYNLARATASHQNSLYYWTEVAHSAIGERKDRTAKNPAWPTSDEDAIRKLRKLVDAEEPTFQGPQALREIDKTNAELSKLRARIAELNKEFERRGGWPRFYVVQNNNGHIHSTTACQTCYPTTKFGWVTELSGLTEEDAVKAQGPILCSVCFPTAPVEWTLGKPKKERCKGSGQSPKGGTLTRHGMRSFGDCPVCGERGTLSPNSYVRAHPPKEETA